MAKDKTDKKIKLFSATAFAIGAMIGGGVFVLGGVALKQTGPSALASFLIAGVVVLLSALSFAVIASNASGKESGYSYVGDLLGSPIWGFLTSWCFYLGGIIGASFVLTAFGTYMHEFVTHNIGVIIWAIAAAILLTLVNLGPASEIGKIETFLVGVKLLILALLIVFGIYHISGGDFTPFAAHGVQQIFTTSAYLFIAFLGFNVITNISGDIDNPTKTVPKAIMLSMLVVTIAYAGIVVALLAAHITNYSESSVGQAAKNLIGSIGGGLVIIGALISTLSSANANVLGSSEIMVRLAAKKQVPTILGTMKNGHPYFSVLAGAVLYVALILTKQISFVIGLANTVAIIALIIVNIAAAKALTNASHSGMRLPLGWFLPIIGMIGAAAQFLFMPKATIAVGAGLFALGIVVYSLRVKFHIPRLHQLILETVELREGPLSRSLKR